MTDHLLAIFIRLRVRLIAADVHQRGASAVEYGLLLAGVAAVIAAAVWGYSAVVVDMFTHTCTHISDQIQNTTTSCV